MSEAREFAVGEEGVIDGVKVRCVEGKGQGDCSLCVFSKKSLGWCGELDDKHPHVAASRSDHKWTYFEEVSQ